MTGSYFPDLIVNSIYPLGTLLITKKQRMRTTSQSFCLLLLSCCISLITNAQSLKGYKVDKGLVKTLDQDIKDADAQYKVLMKNLPADKFPRSFYPDKNEYLFCDHQINIQDYKLSKPTVYN